MSLMCRESYQLQSHSRGLYMSTDILLAVICLNRVLLPTLRLLLVRVCEAWRRNIRGEEGAERERLGWNEAIEITEVHGKQEACQKQIRELMVRRNGGSAASSSEKCGPTTLKLGISSSLDTCK